MENTIDVGKYKIPQNGIIKLPNSKLKVLSKFLSKDKTKSMRYTGEKGMDGSKFFEDDRLTIVLEDNFYCHFISKMTLKEAEQFRNNLTKVIEYKQKGGKGQIVMPTHTITEIKEKIKNQKLSKKESKLILSSYSKSLKTE
ncbi:MAG: hypothetical protein WC614_01110 [bacterium]